MSPRLRSCTPEPCAPPQQQCDRVAARATAVTGMASITICGKRFRKPHASRSAQRSPAHPSAPASGPDSGHRHIPLTTSTLAATSPFQCICAAHDVQYRCPAAANSARPPPCRHCLERISAAPSSGRRCPGTCWGVVAASTVKKVLRLVETWDRDFPWVHAYFLHLEVVSGVAPSTSHASSCIPSAKRCSEMDAPPGCARSG